jgi:hypothetical protein
MAKASLKETPGFFQETSGFLSEVPVVVEVALVALVQPAGYGVWLASLDANARYGADALARAWYVAPLPYLQHLITVTPAHWTALQALARKAA